MTHKYLDAQHWNSRNTFPAQTSYALQAQCTTAAPEQGDGPLKESVHDVFRARGTVQRRTMVVAVDISVWPCDRNTALHMRSV